MHKKHPEWKRFTQRIKPPLKSTYSRDFLYRPRVSTIFDFLWKSHRTKVLFDFFQRKTKIFLLSNLYHLIYLKWSHIYPQNIKYILVMCYVWRHRVDKGTKNGHFYPFFGLLWGKNHYYGPTCPYIRYFRVTTVESIIFAPKSPMSSRKLALRGLKMGIFRSFWWKLAKLHIFDS